MPAGRQQLKNSLKIRNSLSKILFLLLFCGCSGCTQLNTVYVPSQLKNFNEEKKSKSKPHLTISVVPRVLHPMTYISAVVKIKGGPISEDFYCQTITWDWGDGTISSTSEDCEPFEEGQQVRTLFTKIHQYSSPGEYKIIFTLGKHSVSTTVNVSGI